MSANCGVISLSSFAYIVSPCLPASQYFLVLINILRSNSNIHYAALGKYISLGLSPQRKEVVSHFTSSCLSVSDSSFRL